MVLLADEVSRHFDPDSSDTEELDTTTEGSSTGGDQRRKNGAAIQASVTGQEEAAVKRAKFGVIATVLLCLGSIICAVYFLTKQSDSRTFELAYEGLVKDIKNLVVWEVRYNFALMDQLSSQVTISAGLMNNTFPFHTEPEYEITGGFVDGMGGIMSAAFAPLITHEQREEWETYSVNNQDWVINSAFLKEVHPVHRDALHGTIQDHEHDRRRLQSGDISPFVYEYGANGEKIRASSQPGDFLAPLWQVSPADVGAVNMNLLSDPRILKLYQTMRNSGLVVLSENTEIGDLFDFLFDPNEKPFKKDPHAFILAPVFNEIIEKENQEFVGFLIGVTPYGNLLDRLIPENNDGGILAVIEDTCGNVLSFELSSGKALFLGYEDMHDPDLESYVDVTENIELYPEDIVVDCTHTLYLYPTEVLVEAYSSQSPWPYVGIIGAALALGLLFVFYDYLVSRLQAKTKRNAVLTSSIVASLFPGKIAEKLVNEAQQNERKATDMSRGHQSRLQSFMYGDDAVDRTKKSAIRGKPLAELFPQATVMFGDLVGFTAWSSQREPHQVFTLLETIYASFDEIAAKRRVFKVETIGDCYVAVCGLPTPNKKHAVVMARFADECCCNMGSVLNELEVELGPDTAMLGIRIGLHSGPVTAGVLRGERARFQLFGDTVNTTSRIEATGQKNRVHLSQETASRLIDEGKEHWVTPREDTIVAKGKGELKTYWLNLQKTTTSISGGSDRLSAENGDVAREARPETLNPALLSLNDRVVEWNTDILESFLKQIIAHRRRAGIKADPLPKMKALEAKFKNPEGQPIDETKDAIPLPRYDSDLSDLDTSLVEIDQKAKAQLKGYVSTIAQLYRKNAFHNYAHASHVTLSCVKLFNQLGSSGHPGASGDPTEQNAFGIANDPLVQFALVFSAMIHDVDHPGCTNNTLKAENDELSCLYGHRSCAEQNSIDVAWTLLLEDTYEDLRHLIYSTTEELVCFRQIVVNAIIATDVMDKSLGAARKKRWEKAFASSSKDLSISEGSTVDSNYRNSQMQVQTNLKATIVMEHLIQASDVAHTMQHWHVYRRWNERLFREHWAAFKQGRVPDPSISWYDGEIAFFDYYVIPLAMKLKECGVFGVSGEECLSWARQNREEWVVRGKETVEEYLQGIEDQ